MTDRSGRVSDVGMVRGKATYYDRELFSGSLMADGNTRYWPKLSGVVAAVDWPLGTKLLVNGILPVVVSDTGKLERGVGHLDMTEIDFIYLAGSLAPGVIEIMVREIP